MPLHEYLGRSATADPDRTALVCGPGRYTYGELQQACEGLSFELADGGLALGDRVLVLLPNSVEAVISIFAIAAAGGCVVAADPSTPHARLRYIIEHSGAGVVIAPFDRLEAVLDATASATRRPRLVLVGDDDGVTTEHCTSFAAAAARRKPATLPVITAQDRAAIIYTSGSTGEPKGVTLSHGNFDFVTEAVGSYLRHTADDVLLCALQLAFGYGMLQLLVSVRSGGCLVLRRGFGFAYDIVNTIAEERVTGFAGVPTMFALLLQLDDVGDKLSSLRYVTNAAAAMPASFVPRLQALLPGTVIYLMHGQTECLRTSYLPPAEAGARPTSVGKGIPGVELWIEDDHGRRPPPGTPGELMVRGPNVMLGYWNDDEETARVIRYGENRDDRVLRTGDLFTTDDDGYFYFVARTDDIIKSRGQKVSPHEIEQLLYAHDSVLEARVLGVPDPILGQAVRAEVVLVDGAVVTDIELKRYLRPRLEDFKQPQVIAFVDSLPKSTSGKIRRT